jgi:50S ribosomal protein L16 3-hydroxylase
MGKPIPPLPAPVGTFSMARFSLERLLGGITPEAFLAEYWQKKPLLVRQALPGFGDWLNRDSLSALAQRDDAESRLVRFTRGQCLLDRGPFEADDLAGLPKKNWSLLVSGVNHFLPDGDALLHAFDFIPLARLDDLMVSFAPPGGGVGPHFDSYDVFLIQGQGRRRWEISAQDDLEVMDGAPLRILKRFTPEQSWDLEPGDMLYLPPQYAHNGVALTDCMTWSVGFRVPTAEDMVGNFLNYLQDNLKPSGIYQDPDLKRPRHPAEIPGTMLDQVAAMLKAIHWDKDTVADFLGSYISEPKSHIFFDPPERPLKQAAFAKAAAKQGLRLDPRSQLLFRGDIFYMNGERTVSTPEALATLQSLADHRRLAPGTIDAALLPQLHEWYVAGYLLPGTNG